MSTGRHLLCFQIAEQRAVSGEYFHMHGRFIDQIKCRAKLAVIWIGVNLQTQSVLGGNIELIDARSRTRFEPNPENPGFRLAELAFAGPENVGRIGANSTENIPDQYRIRTGQSQQSVQIQHSRARLR